MLNANMPRRVYSVINANPLRCAFGLQLFLVGFFRSDLLPMPLLRAYVEPQWLYGGGQCLAGLLLLLTLNTRLTWYGRSATIFATSVAAMVAWALWQLGSTGTLLYLVMAGMLLTRLGRHD